MQTDFYVDGFNLYHQAVRGTPYKWLDLLTLLDRAFPRNTVNQIRYFTANVVSRADDPSKPQRQHAYLRALNTIPCLSIHYGHFRCDVRSMRRADDPKERVAVLRTEEKGSDVNLATYLLLDAFTAPARCAIVVSNDSDLALPIRKLVDRGSCVGVFSPGRTVSKKLEEVASFVRTLRPSLLPRSQFPSELEDDRGRVIRKPVAW